MNSAIAEGKVRHARLQPVKHAFEYPVYFFKFDVDQLAHLSEDCKFFSLNRWNVLSLYERNYLRPTQKKLREKVEELLREKGVLVTPEKIELITQARYFGWVFNPVSFFFCWSQTDELIASIVDVNNTFGEGHAYLLTEFERTGQGRLKAKADKVFHVSPFFDRKGEYHFEFDIRPDSVDIILDYHEGGILRLASSWVGSYQPFQTRKILSILRKYPFGGWLTVIRIHTQAAILFFIKKLPIFSKPEPVSEMTIRRKSQ